MVGIVGDLHMIGCDIHFKDLENYGTVGEGLAQSKGCWER